MSQVTIRNLIKTFPGAKGAGNTVVHGINLEIRSGEFMVLVGPSGCGKSTTLRMIAGLEDITGGEILIDDRVINDVQPKDRDIAMVFQNYALYPHMSVRENMAFGLKLRGFPKAEINTRVDEAAAMLGLAEYMERKPKALSGGQRQRVAVGRAIVRKPKVFLFDEPLSNLDAKMRVSMRTEIAKLHSNLGTTMIYVTHDQTEAMTMGDRICVMKDGHIMQVAEPLELYDRPENLFVAGFIGSPQMNTITGAFKRDGGQYVFEEASRFPASRITMRVPDALGTRAAEYIGKPIVLGIRPEDIHEAGDASHPKAKETHATVRVDLVEPMGSETYLHLSTGEHALTARVAATSRATEGQGIPIHFDLAKAHLFDPATGNRL